MENTNLNRSASIIVNTCLNVKKGEVIAVLCDFPNLKIGEALGKQIQKCQAEAVMAVFPPRKAHGENPPQAAIAALNCADGAILAGTYSLASSPARIDATANGIRIINIPACSEDVFNSKAMQIDFLKERSSVECLQKILEESTSIHISSSSGTDLTVGLCGRKGVPQTGLAHNPGEWSPAPNIEAAIGPAMDKVDGVLVVDGVLIPGGIPTEPVEIVISGGKIVKINGGEDAVTFRKLLESYNNPNMYQIVELGFGLNPNSELGLGIMAEDESKKGTVHFGIGEGRTFGLDNIAPAHFDLVILSPTVCADGQTILKNGKYIIKGI